MSNEGQWILYKCNIELVCVHDLHLYTSTETCFQGKVSYGPDPDLC